MGLRDFYSVAQGISSFQSNLKFEVRKLAYLWCVVMSHSIRAGRQAPLYILCDSLMPARGTIMTLAPSNGALDYVSSAFRRYTFLIAGLPAMIISLQGRCIKYVIFPPLAVLEKTFRLQSACAQVTYLEPSCFGIMLRAFPCWDDQWTSYRGQPWSLLRLTPWRKAKSMELPISGQCPLMCYSGEWWSIFVDTQRFGITFYLNPNDALDVGMRATARLVSRVRKSV
jgi:hypothetical protein